LSQVGELELAANLLETCERELARESAGLWVHYQFQVGLSMHLYTKKDLYGALEPMERACSLAERIGDQRLAWLAHVALGIIQIELGMLEEGCASQSLAAAHAKAASLSDYECGTNSALALAHWLMGRLHEARAFAEAALRQALGARRGQALIYLYLARIESDAGDQTAAEAHARTSIDRAGDVLPLLSPAKAVLAQIFLRTQRFEEAAALSCETLVELQGMPGVEDFEALIPLTAAEALWAIGRQEEAKRALKFGRERLLARAQLITDPHIQQRFLALRDHAQTLRLAREWLDDAP
jgi:hypothetical protein